MKYNYKDILLGILLGIITTSIFFLMVGEVETEIKIGSSYDNEKVAILFTEKDKIEIINLDESENITINVQEDNIDFKIYSNDGSETEELLKDKIIEFKFPEGLLAEELEIKLIVVN
ncbi:uncharacterized protein METZ01_LOCUS153626 [marine metagenome]|uniref:Uncharacterized protein n=1 Tax=marine metagenome TaxID=408172 RepID=A0A382AI17_9ZZZZ